MKIKKTSAFYFLTLFFLILCIEFIGLGVRFFGENRYKTSKQDSNYYTIMAIGESTTAELFADKQNGPWPSFLERRIKKDYPYSKIRIINAASSGTNTFFIAQNYEGLLKKHKPDMVIAMVGINDNALKFNVLEVNRFSLFINNLSFVKILKWCSKIITQLVSPPINYEKYYKKNKSKEIIWKALKLDREYNNSKLPLLEFNINNPEDDLLVHLYFAHLKNKNHNLNTKSMLINFSRLWLEKYPFNSNVVYIYSTLMEEKNNNAECIRAIRNFNKSIIHQSENLNAHLSLCLSKAKGSNEQFEANGKYFYKNQLSSIENTKINVSHLIKMSKKY